MESSPLDLLAQAELLLESASAEEAVDVSAQAVRALAAANAAVDVRGRVLVKHAEILHKLGRFTEAVEAAKTATQLAPPPWNAYLRLGMSAFALEEFESALSAFSRGADLAKSLPAAVQSTFATWLRKCRAELEAEMEEAGLSPAAPAPSAEVSSPAPVVPLPSVRHQFYQSMEWVTCDYYCKGRVADDVEVQFRSDSFMIAIRLEDGRRHEEEVVLANSVVPAECKYSVGRVKIEVLLRKAAALNWNSFERPAAAVADSAPAAAAVTAASPYYNTDAMDKHTYPTSRPRKVDWVAVEKEVEEDKLDGEAGLNKVFRDIYANASEEQRRAMNKSFVESGGTVLSTNWTDVGSKTVEGTPPKGLEMRSWKDDV